MIEHISGKLVEKNPTHVVIDCGGVGYFLNISLNTFSKLSDNENAKLLTHYVVREDAHLLYGFIDRTERDVFRLLIAVNGVGVNTARVILSTLTPGQVQDAISTENVDSLKAVKGIGAKTAQRIIIDLKDKINKLDTDNETVTNAVSVNNTSKEEALSALEVLGFTRKQAIKPIEKFLKNEPGLTVEELIKQALKVL